MNNLSTIIVAKDNPPYLNETIESVQDISAEIIIMDIGLDHDVKNNLSSNSKIKIIEIQEKVPYVELIRQKSFSYASNDYILLLDPDEVVSPELKQVIAKEYSQHDGLSIPRKNIIFGKWIEHSRWWPDYQLRVFRKNLIHWPTQLHAPPTLDGKIYEVPAEEKNALIHYNYQNINEFFSKMTRYAESEAGDILENKESTQFSTYISKGINEFISRYFGSQGYKDGMHGFVLSFFQMMYYFLVYFYIWEKNKYQESTDQTQLARSAETFFRKGLYEVNFWMIKEKLIQSGQTLKNRLLNQLLKD